jgi:hypothetical protein
MTDFPADDATLPGRCRDALVAQARPVFSNSARFWAGGHHLLVVVHRPLVFVVKGVVGFLLMTSSLW